LVLALAALLQSSLSRSDEIRVVALSQISTADGYARVQQFHDIDTFSTCPAFLQSIIPTSFPILTIFRLFRTCTLVNAIQIKSHLDEVNEKSDHYAWID
jgi:hypothetical protein